jgi:hypothetical protein
MIGQIKRIGIAALVLSVFLGAASLGFAKGHDQGVADGTPNDPSTLRGGAVAGVGVPGIGSAAFGGLCREGFCGVVGDPGQTYGRDIVSQQRAADIRRVKPVVANNPRK